jgi:hypothetical protein
MNRPQLQQITEKFDYKIELNNCSTEKFDYKIELNNCSTIFGKGRGTLEKIGT